MRQLLIIFTILLTTATTYSQTAELDSLLLADTYPIPTLPSFSVVFDSVMSRSPQRIKLQQARLESLYNMGLMKRDWMNYISMNTSYYYGKGGILGTTQTQTGIVSSLTDQATSTYGAGVGLGFTLGSVLNYKSKVKIAKAKLNQVESDLKTFEQELRMKLYAQYSQLEADLAAFNANSILMEMSQTQVEIKEKEYRLGRIDLQQVITARQNYNQILTTNEGLKKSCKIGIYYFEQLSGIDFRDLPSKGK